MEEQPIQNDVNNKQKPRWYFHASSLVVGFLFIGPFILPLVWLNPKYSSSKKVWYSVIILVLSALILKLTIKSFENIHEYYKLLEGQY